jgi:hypothetical protein
VLEGDPGNWAAVARTISDRVRELGWRRRELAAHPHAPFTVVREFQRPASLFFSGILLSMPAITSGIRSFSHEAPMQFWRISSATDSGSAKDSADTVQPRCKSRTWRYAGRRGCR